MFAKNLHFLNGIVAPAGHFNMKSYLIASALTFSIFIINALLLTISAYTQEQDPDPLQIIISATRSEKPINQVASSVTVIDSKKIEEQQDRSVIDALKSEPTLDVVSTGTMGSSTTVSIRGANPEHTMVLLDGIQLNNPILPSRSFNFADLMLNDVERIEILRGPQSTLYGSDAMGGVINVISKKGQGPLAVKASAEAGSFSSFTEQTSVSAGEDNYNYALSVLRQDSDGISAADSRLGNTEKDGYENTSYFARLGIVPTEDTEINTVFRAIDSSSDLDNFGGAFGDDPNREQSNNQYFWGNSLISKFLDDSLKTTLSYSYADQSFNDDNNPDINSSDILRSKYEGNVDTLHGQFDYQVTQALSVIAGIENKEETGESRYSSDGAFGPFESDFDEISSTTNGYFVQTNIEVLDQLFLNAGIRIDDHSKFGSETTYRIAPVWLLNGARTKIFSTVGTAFKAPSLFQLYSSFGSQDLAPEESFAVDAGVEQDLIEDRVSVSLTYFHQNFDDLINFDPNTFIFNNISSATTSGLETGIKAKLCQWTEFNLGYTYLDATNDDTGAALLRRARNKFSADLRVIPNDSWDFGIQSNFRSSRFDNDFSGLEAKTETLAGYTTVDLLARHKIDQNIELFARVENLFDQNYQEVLGYGTYGVGAYGGVRVKF